MAWASAQGEASLEHSAVWLVQGALAMELVVMEVANVDSAIHHEHGAVDTLVTSPSAFELRAVVPGHRT